MCNEYMPFGNRKYLTKAERQAFMDTTKRAAPEIKTFCLTLAYIGARISEVLALVPQRPNPRSWLFRLCRRLGGLAGSNSGRCMRVRSTRYYSFLLRELSQNGALWRFESEVPADYDFSTNVRME